MFRFNRHRLLSDVVAALLLAALLLRGLTPPGYMPGAGPVGLKLCTSIGLVDVGSSGTTHDGAGADPDHTKGVCPYAAVAGTAPPPPLTDYAPVIDAADRSAVPVSGAPISRGAELAPWPRGPPVPR